MVQLPPRLESTLHPAAVAGKDIERYTITAHGGNPASLTDVDIQLSVDARGQLGVTSREKETNIAHRLIKRLKLELIRSSIQKQGYK